MELWVAENSTKNMCVSGFSSEKSRYALLALWFYFVEIIYIEIAFFTTSSFIFQRNWHYFALNLQKKKRKKKKKVKGRGKRGKNLGRFGKLKHTYNFFGLVYICG